MEIGPLDKGRNVELRKGDTLVVRLPENPTTGYRWSVEEDGTILQLQSTHFDLTEGAGVGAGGWRTLTFRAEAAGTSKVQLRMWEHWEGDASVTERYVVTVQVTD
jgi:inhibitor of cysteine peptidase